MWGELIERIWEVDPAAHSRLQIFLSYPGFHALMFHRVAHWLWQNKFKLSASLVSYWGRILTGIEIHPGAQIGRRVFIDHGTGVVIGETAIVGDDVVIYQGVTLGAASAARMGAISRNKKRHPTIGKGVVIGCGTSIEGNITIGENSRISSCTVILEDIPPDSIVVGTPGRILSRQSQNKEKNQQPTEISTKQTTSFD